MECFICLDNIDISKNNFYLSCCNKYTHYNCIKSWVKHNKKFNITNCPYCTKYNNDISNLFYDNIDIIIIDNNYSNINLQNNNFLSLFYFIFITLIILFIVLFFHV